MRLASAALLACALGLAACGPDPVAQAQAQAPAAAAPVPGVYQARTDIGPNGEPLEIKAIKPAYLRDRNVRAQVPYNGPDAAGTIVDAGDTNREVGEEVGALLAHPGESRALHRRQGSRLEDPHAELLVDLARQGLARGAGVLDVAGGPAGPPPVHESGAATQLEQHLGPAVALPGHHGVGGGEQGHPAAQLLGDGAGQAHTAIGALIEGAAS